MYTVDLHLKRETVQSALFNLNQGIQLMRKSKEHVGCFIVGYGSSGGSHKIKTAVLEELEKMVSSHQIKGYLVGSEVDIFNVKYQQLKGKELIPEEVKKRKNPGEIIVII